jgi:glutamate 5-kinase
MLTKVLAAKRAARSGASTDRLRSVTGVRLAAGEAIGTPLIAPEAPLGAQAVARRSRAARRAPHARSRCRGALAREAEPAADRPPRWTESSAELSAASIPAVARSPAPRHYGAYPAHTRKPSSEIEAILGYIDEPVLIHRDNLVLLDDCTSAQPSAQEAIDGTG